MRLRTSTIDSTTHYLHRPWRIKPKYRQDIAVATFFAGETAPGDNEEEDSYFITIRTLAYQLDIHHKPALTQAFPL